MPTKNERQPPTRSEASAKPRPAKTLRLGRVKAAIWENRSDDRTFYNVTFSRTYMDSEKKFQETDSFGRDDLPLIAKLASEAHTAIYRELTAAKAGTAESA